MRIRICLQEQIRATAPSGTPADYQILLRVPGIGYKSAARIVKARRMGVLDFDDLKKMGVVLKRALYFITCKGR